MEEKKLYDKPWKRTVRDTAEERDLGYGRLPNFGSGKIMEMWWDFHPDATRDRVVKIRIGKEEVIVDADHLLKFIRWV